MQSSALRLIDCVKIHPWLIAMAGLQSILQDTCAIAPFLRRNQIAYVPAALLAVLDPRGFAGAEPHYTAEIP